MKGLELHHTFSHKLWKIMKIRLCMHFFLSCSCKFPNTFYDECLHIPTAEFQKPKDNSKWFFEGLSGKCQMIMGAHDGSHLTKIGARENNPFQQYFRKSFSSRPWRWAEIIYMYECQHKFVKAMNVWSCALNPRLHTMCEPQLHIALDLLWRNVHSFHSETTWQIQTIF